MDESIFQFKGFSIIRSLIERKDAAPSNKLSFRFTPKGILNKSDSNFQLHLGVQIEDENKAINIVIQSVANYKFDDSQSVEQLDDFFYINAPAILFPYIRAYISTLTNLSGFETITLPTLNLSGLAEELKKNTTEI